MAEKENPQGILAVVQQKQWQLDDLTQESFCRGVAIVAPQDPGNVGTVLRTIDAAGADGLILLDSRTGIGSSVDPYHPSSVRASMGTILWKPFVHESFDNFISWARRGEYRLIGTSAHARLDYRELKLADISWFLVLGSEQKGLTQEQAVACDVLVSLPMRGRASSLSCCGGRDPVPR